MTWLLPAAVLAACAALYLRDRRERVRRRHGYKPLNPDWFR